MAGGPAIIDLTGKRFCRLIVLEFSHRTATATTRRLHWRVQCDCGEETTVAGHDLKSGNTTSCGCFHLEKAALFNRSHGMRDHPAYTNNFMSMWARCTNPRNSRFKDYGGRGIYVCDRWRDFDAFWADMGAGWQPGLTIDRKDVNGNYEPDNCRWATKAEQQENRRKVLTVETPWGEMRLADAARKSGINYYALHTRLRNGWPLSRLFEPLHT